MPKGGPNDCTIGPPASIVLSVQQNGAAGQDFPVIVNGVHPRIINACDTIFGTIGGICDPYITHADGTLVGFGCANAVRPGETITIYAVGLGSTSPTVKTGEAAPSSPPATVNAPYPLMVSFQLNVPPASPAPPNVWSPAPQWFYADYVGLVPGYVGLYQINFSAPKNLPSNLFFSGYGPNMRISMGAGSTIGPADGVTFADVCVKPQ
jgi:hypothetical protein